MKASETLPRGLGESSGKRLPVGHRAMFETGQIRMRPPRGSNPRPPAYMAGALPTALDGRSLRGTSEKRQVCKVYERLMNGEKRAAGWLTRDLRWTSEELLIACERILRGVRGADERFMRQRYRNKQILRGK